MWSYAGMTERGVEAQATIAAYFGRGCPGGVDGGGIGLGWGTGPGREEVEGRRVAAGGGGGEEDESMQVVKEQGRGQTMKRPEVVGRKDQR